MMLIQHPEACILVYRLLPVPGEGGAGTHHTVNISLRSPGTPTFFLLFAHSGWDAALVAVYTPYHSL